MSTTPFRTAFWALGFAFAMTVIMMIPNPKQIRIALNSHRSSNSFPYQETLITSLDSDLEQFEEASPNTNIATDETPDKATVEATSVASVDETTPLPEPPVRVASSNPAATIGYLPPSHREGVHPQPIPPEFPSNESPEKVADEPLNIPVPEPLHEEQDHKLATQSVSQLASAPAGKKDHKKESAPANEVKGDQEVLSGEGEVMDDEFAAPLLPVEKDSPASVFPPHTPSPPRNSSDKQSRNDESANDFTDPSISITPSHQPGRWDFRFQNASVDQVFKALGKLQDCNVMVDEEIQHLYTDRFENAEPAQVFAIVVKEHGCAVSRRGNLLILTKRSNVTYR